MILHVYNCINLLNKYLYTSGPLKSYEVKPIYSVFRSLKLYSRLGPPNTMNTMNTDIVEQPNDHITDSLYKS